MLDDHLREEQPAKPHSAHRQRQDIGTTVSKKIIRIGSYSFEAWYNEQPKNGFHYFIDLNGNPSWPNEEKFQLNFFMDIDCAAIPKSTHFNIQYSSSEFKRVNFITLKKAEFTCELGITLAINYQDWEMAESLSKFVYRLVDSVKEEAGFDANPVKTEYGYFIEICSRKTNVKNIFSWYSEMEHFIEKIYQRELANIPTPFHTNQKYGESAFHWWVRYVVVPLIGSGTIAAVIAKFLFNDG